MYNKLGTAKAGYAQYPAFTLCIGGCIMIETVVSANMLIGEVMRVKKNHLAPDFPTGSEKRLCIVSGIHGDEVGGQYICYEVIRRIKRNFEKLSGIVDVYPSVNPMGLEAQYRDVPVFDTDMNTLFPGTKEGTVGEYTAAKLMKDIEGADICVDIHSSSIYIKEIPQVRINSDVAEALAPFASCMNVDVVWVHPSSTVMAGSLAHALNEIGVKSMVVESGVALKIDYDYSNQIVDGLFSLMSKMGIWQDTVNPDHRPKFAKDKDVCYVNAESSGIFIPVAKHSQYIQKGEIIGRIVNVLTGSEEETIRSPRNGIVFSLREYPVIEEGSLVARIYGGSQ